MSTPVRIPADVEREDTILAGLTARQLLLLSGAGTILYGAFTATRPFLPVAVFLIAAVPLAGIAALLALGRRDGLPLDRLVLAALRQHLAPRYRIAAPDGIRPAPAWLAARARPADEPGQPTGQVSPAPLNLPAESVTEAGVIDLGREGMAVIAVCSTVNFALRTPEEQEALTAAFGRYLHSLTAPVQIVVRAERLDVSAQIAELQESAPHLPHPALEHAALEHADYLEQLRQTSNLLRRQVLLVIREPLRTTAPAELDFGGPRRTRRGGRNRQDQAGDAARRAAEARLARRVEEASELLGPVGITVTALDAGQATAVLAAACNPDSLLPPSSGLAGAHDVITTTAPAYEEDTGPHPSAEEPPGGDDRRWASQANPWAEGGEEL
ncbi:PrgI family protein [Streptomyces sp. DSM 44917]|uniref:PrgI family protein n=1 Tax=Streptomyces boetiae TaxID=3075541 RepID=A0ABU2L6N4_9ACTN|nr:PrgI family protein [Streptomyces sp. DSM 44917]MDT0307219.1 PrgI family protein [Streptomyces sp. DSM 44917]